MSTTYHPKRHLSGNRPKSFATAAISAAALASATLALAGAATATPAGPAALARNFVLTRRRSETLLSGFDWLYGGTSS